MPHTLKIIMNVKLKAFEVKIMWLDLQIFGFRALWSPYFLFTVIIIGILYILMTITFRHKFGNVPKPTILQIIYFYLGLILLYIAKGAPIDLLSHIMLSAHMIQMVILYLVIPILFILSLPHWIIEKFIELPIIKPIFTFFTHPIIALLLFNFLFALYHLPVIFDFSKSSQLAHVSITTILFILAIFMWWPIVTPLEKYNRLNPLLKMIYLVGSIFIVSIACALIIFAKEPLFEAYSAKGAWIQSLSLCVPIDILNGLSGNLSGAEFFSPLSTLEDQQLGGILMMFLQQFIYGLIIARIFFGWFSDKNMTIDPLPTAEDRNN